LRTNLANAGKPHHLLIGDSHDPEMIHKVGQLSPYDFLFIDGDHSVAGVRADFRNYQSLVRSGGIIAFDDYKDWQFSPNVKVGVDGLRAEFDQFCVIGDAITYWHEDFYKKSNIFFLLKK
jgi:hypothetical protein